MSARARGRTHWLAGSAVLACLLLALTGAVSAYGARAARKAPHVTSVRCWPPKACGGSPHSVAPGGTLRFKGRNLKPGMRVLFPRKRTQGARAATVGAKLLRANGLTAKVPAAAKSGRVRIAARHGRRSNAVGPIRIVRPVKRQSPKGSGTAFDGTGMWIWYVSRSSGGQAAGIIAQAKGAGVTTVFVKSSDGTTWWPQFSPELIAAVKAAGIHICAWQFVYGKNPQTEATLGARAAQLGADCLVIDAESAYEGKYAQAETYVEGLRAQIGPAYPVGLSGFPYVDFHPGFPYSVFLGPGGAQYSLPQIYWKAIGTTVDNAFAHTYLWNRVYERPLFPVGQLYNNPRPPDVVRFRQLASAYGASGVSWWSWQSAAAAGWGAISGSFAPLAEPLPAASFPSLQSGSHGDVVLWAQLHLITAGHAVSSNGLYDSATKQAVVAFQTARGLPVTGRVDAGTWPALLGYEPAAPDWNKGTAAARAARTGQSAPRSAHIRAVRNELR